MRPKEDRRSQIMAGPGLSQECPSVPGFCRIFIPNFADHENPRVALTGKDVLFVWGSVCSKSFYSLRDSLIRAPILAFPMETGQYILDTATSNFGLGGVEPVVAYCSRAL